MRTTSILAMLGLCCLFVSISVADVTLPAIFGDSMVLQQKTNIPVWGWADPGEKVMVTVRSRSKTTKADSNGKWMLRLGSIDAGGPFTLVIKANNTITLEDVMVGEVWLCSGQSNMEWSLKKLKTYEQEIARSDFPSLRLFRIKKTISDEPNEIVNAQWTRCIPDTAKDFSGTGYFFGKYLQQQLKVPVGLIQSAWGGTRIEPWIPSEVYNKSWNKPNENSKQQPNVTFNGMINPIIPYAIKGAIWYQGETNCIQKDKMLYYDKFETMVKSWRDLWGQGDFGFYFVQLAPYNYTTKFKLNSQELAYFWETQTKCLDIRNTGMAGTMDIGDVNNIHPKNKHELGRRLALWALAKDYGKKDIEYCGPLYKSMKIKRDKIYISFDYTDGGLKTRDGRAPSWFSVAGEDRVFYPAKAFIDGDKIIVHCEKAQKPEAVRFAWDQAAVPNLCNAEGLPASPFRTDKWQP